MNILKLIQKASALVVALLCLQLTAGAQAVTELTDEKDIPFAGGLMDYKGKPMDDSLKFDIYYPTGATSDKKYPVFFSLHGGSFTTATNQSVTSFSDAFAEKGFVVIAPDYRVGYEDKSNGTPCSGDSTALQEAIYRAMQDVNSCIRYVANHASRFHIDTSWIFVGGASAGGTLTLNLAYINDSVAAAIYPKTVARWGKLQTTGNNEPYNYTIKGLCPMWGGLPSNDGIINAKSAIPSILFKGGRDVNLPNGIGFYTGCPTYSRVRAGLGIYNLLTAFNVPCVYHFQPVAPHSAYDDDFIVQQTACFFNGLMNGAPYSGLYQYYDASCR